MKRILFLIPLLFLAVNLFAQDESKRIAEQIAPLLSDDISLVVHVDLGKIDFEPLDKKLRPALLERVELINAIRSVEFSYTDLTKEEFEKNIDEAKAAAVGFLTMTKTVYGVKEVYFLGSFATLPYIGPGILAIPITEETTVGSLQKFLEENNRFQCRSSKGFLLAMPDNGWISDVNPDWFWKVFAPEKPLDRPELLAALRELEGSSTKAVIIPPPYFKRVFEETSTELPAPFEGMPTTVLTEGIKWAALGVEFNEPKLELIICSEDDAAAMRLRKALEILPELEIFTEDVEFFSSKFLFSPENIRNFIANLIPKRSGDKLKLTVNAEFLALNAEPFLEKSPETIKAARSMAANTRCMNQMKYIVLAMHNYHDTHNRLQAPYTSDAEGKRLHSWRVALMPYMEEENLYAKIRHNEPWDSEYNKQFHSQCPAVLQCPEALARFPEMREKGLTTYSLIVGKNSYPPDRQMDFRQVSDGSSNTWAVVERKTPVCWMDPAGDVLEEDVLKGIDKSEKGIGLFHTKDGKRGIHAGFFDGSVRFFPENLSQESLKRFTIRNDDLMYLEEYDE